jgi:hypothetical protein
MHAFSLVGETALHVVTGSLGACCQREAGVLAWQTWCVLAGDLRVTDDASPGEWIAPRLEGEFGAVTLAVPSGYEAYARICHPPSDREGRPVSWSEVARVTGRRAHPLMQWHALVGSWDPLDFTGSLWPGHDPPRGDLAPRPLEALCEPLAEHTTDVEHCFFAVWFGWSWVHGGGMSRITLALADETGGSTPESVECPPGAFSADELSRRRLVLPHRDYVLLEGPLCALQRLGDPAGVRGFAQHSPNLLWPADRAWCVASEIDFDSTLVGGSAELIGAILETAELDAWPVGPDDSLAFDADLVNHVPASPPST